MEQLNCSTLLCWFVGLQLDVPVRHPTTLTKGRDRLLSGNVAQLFFVQIPGQAKVRWSFTCTAAACNLVRRRTLLAAA